MSNLEQYDNAGSAFGDFLSHLRPYPVPPGFRFALLYAAGGSILLLLAGLAASALPTSQDLAGHLAIGAAPVGSVLELFRAPSSALVFFGVAGLMVTAVIGVRRRVEGAGVLAALTMFGVVAGVWAAVGWLIVGIAFLTTLVLWLFVIALILGAGTVAFRAQWAMAIGMVAAALFLASWLQNATNDTTTTAGATRAPEGSQSVAAPPPAEEQPGPRHLPPEKPALTQQRIALEARMTSEYDAWHEVPYDPPCDQATRGQELASFRDMIAQMKQRLREAARYDEPGAFRQVAGDLERVDREWARALTDPHGVYERFGRCPSAVGVMAFRW
jgi:hypothetical protein